METCHIAEHYRQKVMCNVIRHFFCMKNRNRENRYRSFYPKTNQNRTGNNGTVTELQLNTTCVQLTTDLTNT